MHAQKIKLLFDMKQFQNFNSNKYATGIFRVCDEIFKRLAASNEVDLYCLIGSKKRYANVIQYLEKNSPKHLEKIIYLKYLNKIDRNLNIFAKIKSIIAKILYKNEYENVVKNFDWYFSPFDAVPSLFYNNIKTSIIIHDMIPLLCSDVMDLGLVKSFRNLVDNLKTDLIFFYSEYTRNDFLNYRKDYNPEKTALISLAADEKFKPIKDQNLISVTKEKYKIKTPKYFLSVSNFSPRKNLLFVVKNFLEFIQNNQIEDLSLVLCGPEPKLLENILVDKFPQYKSLFNKITFTGFVDDDDLPALYTGAMAFVYMSLYEGFGLPPLEAMQCGTPVITSNTTSLPEVVGNAGITLDPKNNQNLVETFNKIYKNETLKAELSEKGLKRSQMFSWDKSTIQIIYSLNLIYNSK
jgi:glycosyltransferase involved in cell wall biosynthesis